MTEQDLKHLKMILVDYLFIGGKQKEAVESLMYKIEEELLKK
jgi:hypothetical protein